MTGRLRTLLAVSTIAAAAAVASGCGGGGGGSDVDVGPAAAVPGSAPVYLEATVRPEGTAAQSAQAALGKILDSPDPGAKLQNLIEQSAAEEGQQITYAQDIQPWLGERVGVFFSNFAEDSDGAAVIETTDTDAAQAFLDKVAEPDSTTEDVAGVQATVEKDGDVSGIVGDFVVSGSKAGFEAAADAEGGDSLGDSDDFKDSIDDLPDDSLGTLYAQPKDFLEAIPPEDVDPQARALLEKAAGDSLDEPVVGDLSASAEDIQLNVSAGGDGVETPPSSLLDSVPAQSWLAFAIGDLGGSVKQTIEQLRDSDIPNFEENLSQIEDVTGASIDELTGALGESALYVQGTNQQSLSGALIVQSNDTELTGRLLGQLQGLITAAPSGRAKALTLPGGGTGFSFSDPTEAPQPFEVAQQNDKIVVGYGAGSAQQALAGSGGAAGGQIATTPAFAAAASKLESLGVDLFLSFPTVFQFAESQGASQDPEFQQAKPYIDALDYLAVGSGSEDDRPSVRLVVGLK